MAFLECSIRLHGSFVCHFTQNKSRYFYYLVQCDPASCLQLYALILTSSPKVFPLTPFTLPTLGHLNLFFCWYLPT